MSAVECSREIEIADAIATGRWSTCSDRDLAAHAMACDVCGDLVTVMGPLRQAHLDACRHAPIPSARVVWWRAHVRARAEAAQTVTQPITWLNGITTVSVIAVAVAVMSAASQLFPRSVSSSVWGLMVRLFDLSTSTRSAAHSLAHVSLLLLDSAVVIWGVAACLLLVPLALYWILAGDR